MECNIKTIFYVLLFTLPAGVFGDFLFTPSHYNLKINTSKNNFKDNPTEDDLRFNGNVTITFTIKKTTTDAAGSVEIILNTNPSMKLTSVGLSGQKTKTLVTETIQISHEHKEDKLIIKIPSFDPAYTEYMLQIAFSNPLRNDMTGFYRSSYVDSSNKTSWILTTHFEPVYARRVFPCFDRPDLKATFDIEISAPKDKTTVLCNTPATKGNADGDNVKFICERTVKMSTYLVAFTVSDFKGTGAEKFSSDYPTPSERVLKTYGREEIISKGDAALAQSAGKAAITELSKYLNLGYALKKIDQIGIPDFSAGAMENWGHISFREKSLFFNKTTGSTLTKQANVLTITHELVHQWFGNLVTLESWDFIWLNEAFANYLEYVIASKFQVEDIKASEWELMKQFVVTEMHSRAFETDGLSSAKPLNNKITDESLILPSFNDIPYAKGASVLRMWENALGSAKFQKSLQEYLKKWAFKNTNPQHLFDVFKSEAGMNEDFFKTWTEQAGYPVVEVKKVKNDKYELSQKRFFWDNSSSTSKWLIPITYTNNTGKFDVVPVAWLGKENIAIEVPGKWFIINNQQSGYYRVNYNQENWNALSEALKANHTVIDELNRAQMINDVFSLARSLQGNYVSYSTALDLTKYLEKEKSFYAWKTALNAFEFVQTKLREGEVYSKFNDYVLSLLKPHFEKLSSSSQNHIGKLKNIEISRWACSLGLKDCVNEAEKLFKESAYSKLPDVQEIVLCTVVKHGNVWDGVFKKYSEEKDSALKLLYISALGCTNNKTQAEGFLNKTLEKDTIRPQDRSYVLSSVYNGNLKNVDIAFKFIEKQFAKIAELYGGINPLGKALVGIARKLNSAQEEDRLKALVETIRKREEGKAAKDSLDNALNIAKSNVEWMKQRQRQFNDYFKSSGSFVTYSLSLISLCLAAVWRF